MADHQHLPVQLQLPDRVVDAAFIGIAALRIARQDEHQPFPLLRRQQAQRLDCQQLAFPLGQPARQEQGQAFVVFQAPARPDGLDPLPV
jgi:hypothetical protein